MKLGKHIRRKFVCFSLIAFILMGERIHPEGLDQITLSQEQVHQGNLILVNGEYPYDFASNASLHLCQVNEAQGYDYPVEKEEFQLSLDILPALDSMIRDCDMALGTHVTSIASAWRSLDYQQGLWDSFLVTEGEDYCRAYVAVPGYSEHHTGLAADLGIVYEDGTTGTFSSSENAKWMNDNAYHYGFIRRYREDKAGVTGISNEPWHFRFVGQPHADIMQEQNLCLEEYLEYLKGNSSPEAPLQWEVQGAAYEVYYTSSPTICEPAGSYQVSGDNMGGYIITERIE